MGKTATSETHLAMKTAHHHSVWSNCGIGNSTSEQTSKAQYRSFPQGFHVPINQRGVGGFEVPIGISNVRGGDRYLIVDNEVWLLGASVKDMGHGLCTVIKVDFSPEMVLSLLK